MCFDCHCNARYRIINKNKLIELQPIESVKSLESYEKHVNGYLRDVYNENIERDVVKGMISIIITRAWCNKYHC